MKRYIRTSLTLMLALLMPLCGIGVNLLHCRHSGRMWVLTQMDGLEQQHCKQQPVSAERGEEASHFEMPPCMDLHQFLLDVKAVVSTDTFHLPAPLWSLLPFWAVPAAESSMSFSALFLPRGGGTVKACPPEARELLAQICILRI